MQPGKTFTARIPLTFFCLIVLLLVVACDGNTGPPSVSRTKAAADKQVFVAPGGEIATFDPALASDGNSLGAISMVFTGLVQLDKNLTVQPQLAQSWELGSDGLRWIFYLRPNLQFSDGTPLTSKDVAYSIDRALQPTLKSSTAPAYLALIKDALKLNADKIKTIIGDSILTPDAHTVILVTNKKAAYFPDQLTYPCSYVVEQSLIDKYGNNRFTDHLTEGGGAGPFVVSQYTHNTGIIFVPNPNYYGPKPQLRKVVVPFYKDADTIYKAYQTDQVSVTGIPSASLVEARKQTAEFHRVPNLVISYLQMNYLVKPFDNIKIRQAFALAINKGLIEHQLLKDGSIATNHIVPEGMPGYNPHLMGPAGVKSTAGDPTLARQLLQQGLQEEGWSNVSQMPPLRLSYASDSQDVQNIMVAMLQMWHDILGVDVKADLINFSKLLEELDAARNNPKGLQFWSIAWGADYPDPQDFLTLLFDKGSPFNIASYGQNPTADAAQQQQVQQLLEFADSNPNQQARLQQYQQAEQQLVNDVAWMPWEQRVSNFLLKPCVQGFVFNSMGIMPPNSWVNVYISTATPCARATV